MSGEQESISDPRDETIRQQAETIRQQAARLKQLEDQVKPSGDFAGEQGEC